MRQLDKWLPSKPSQIQQVQVDLETDFIERIQSNFYIPERKDETPPTIKLYPYQIAVLREAHRKDENGKFVYSTVLWSDIKKSAKSSISAAVALDRAQQTEWGSIKIIANDLKQADSRTAYYLRRAMELNPNYEKGVNYRQAGYKITLPNNCTIEAIPIDPGGEAGGNDDLIIFSELWAAKHKAMEQMWTEMTLSPMKYGYSQRWIETYAGYSGESPILERLYNRGVNEGSKLDLSYDNHDLSDLEVYANGDMLALWNTRPRLPWQTNEYYASEEGDLLPSEFQRIHRNQWISSVEKFIEILWWDSCKGQLPQLNKLQPIKLYPYQIAVLREAHRKDENGKFVYSTVLWSDIKKSAKSSISAAVALDRAQQTEWGSIKIIANDLKQADSRTAYYLRRAMELNPNYEKGVNYRQAGYKITLPNNCTIEAIPIDPGGEAGGNDDLIIFSELWAAKHKAMEQMWTEMTLSPMKYGYSQRWIETYAGYSGESPILERLYNRGVNEGSKLDLSYDNHDLSDLEVYANGDMLALWNTRPRLPWQTNEYYASEEGDLLPSEFQRIHRNQWISSVEKFIEILWWDSCKGQLPQLNKLQPVIIAMDAAEGRVDSKSDCFAMIMVSKSNEIVYPHYCGIWQAEAGHYIDYGPIEQELRRLCKEYSVLEVAYDPTQLHDMATRLKSEGVAHFKRFNQGADRLIADKQLRDLITQKRIVHDGNPMLRQHLDNANAKNHGEAGIRLVKRSSGLKIDAAVSLAMAQNRINYYNV